jgi:hypothetical protein
MEHAVYRRALELREVQRPANIELDVSESLVGQQVLNVTHIPCDEVIQRKNLMTSFDQPVAEV